MQNLIAINCVMPPRKYVQYLLKKYIFYDACSIAASLLKDFPFLLAMQEVTFISDIFYAADVSDNPVFESLVTTVRELRFPVKRTFSFENHHSH